MGDFKEYLILILASYVAVSMCGKTRQSSGGHYGTLKGRVRCGVFDYSMYAVGLFPFVCIVLRFLCS